MPLQKTVTPKQMQALDRWAIQTIGIPSMVLMENAGRAVAERVRGLLKRKRIPGQGPVTILCGKGHNGGDGLVVARWLRQFGVPCQVLLAENPKQFSVDTAAQYKIARKLAVKIFYKKSAGRPSLIVDALLGTGFQGEPSAAYARLIHWAIDLKRKYKIPILAADIPSGLNGQNGRASSATIEATETITFHRAKTGLIKKSARPYVGKLTVADIGIPASL